MQRLAELLAEDGWLAPEHREPDADRYRQHLLHVSPDRRVSIVALVWLPGQSTPIHDHVSWCVVGVYEGRERETRYRAVESGGRRHLEAVGSIDALPGHVEVIVPDSLGGRHPRRDRRRRRADDLDPRLRRGHRGPRHEHLPALRRLAGARSAALPLAALDQAGGRPERVAELVEHPLLALADALGVESHEAALLRGVRGRLRHRQQPRAQRRRDSSGVAFSEAMRPTSRISSRTLDPGRRAPAA